MGKPKEKIHYEVEELPRTIGKTTLPNLYASNTIGWAMYLWSHLYSQFPDQMKKQKDMTLQELLTLFHDNKHIL